DGIALDRARRRDVLLEAVASAPPTMKAGPAMWRPSGWQWLVIWLTATLSLGLWLTGAPYGKAQDRAAIIVLLLGALLVWQLSGRRDRPAKDASDIRRPRHRCVTLLAFFTPGRALLGMAVGLLAM